MAWSGRAAGSVIERLRRPAGQVEQTRWLFGGAALLSLALSAPVVLTTGHPLHAGLGLAAVLVLTASWLRRYLTRQCPPVLDLVECVAVLGFALSGPSPMPAFGFCISGAWFRSLYGTGRQTAAHTGGSAVAILLAIALWPLVPGHADPTPLAPVLAVLPILLLTAAVSRHLAVSLFAREQAQQRDTALAALSGKLLATTDRDWIKRFAWDGVVAICSTTPGLHALGASGGGEHLQVLRWTAGLDRPAGTLPRSCVPTEVPTDDAPAQPVADGCPLPSQTSTGVALSWMCLHLPQQPHSWLLLGLEGAQLSPEALLAFRSLLNQVALALRNSDAHHDLSTQALTDGLTGLPNRAAFSEALERRVADQEQALAVMFIDLDDFKVVNDGLGHAAGDELLRHVAAQLRMGVRPGDVCARLGGDEFAVLLPTASRAEAAGVAQRLVEHLSAPVALGSGLAQVGASIGLSFAGPGVSSEQLVQRADVAMYAAKAQGKNRVQVFDACLLQPAPVSDLGRLGITVGP